MPEKRSALEWRNSRVNISRQCELLGMARSTAYYDLQGETEENIRLMNLIDEQYTKTPFYGARKMTHQLIKDGCNVNHKRVKRLMKTMGIQAIYCRPSLSKPTPEHKKFPYLLKGLNITHPNQVWCTDITYIRLQHGFIYLVAIMDWFSRYVLSWNVSISLEGQFCLEALEAAFGRGNPEIFNSDQGSQFTCGEFTNALINANIRISMDGRGRCFDNIFVERLWRSVKYEEVYLKDYTSVSEAVKSLERYFVFYNNERLHQSLEYRTPKDLHFSR